MTKSELSGRLKHLRKQKGKTLAEMSKDTGLTPAALSNYENGIRTPRMDTLDLLSDYFNVDLDYLTGKSEVENRYGFEGIYRKGYESAMKTLSQIIRIPIFKPLSCGTGTWVEEYPEDYIGLPEGYIRTSLPLIANEAEGDSMEPTISNGDLLIFAVGDEVQSGQVGAFGYEGAFYCKRLREHNGDKWLHSDNPEYAPINIEDEEAFRPIGKLRAVVKKQ